MKPLIPGTHWPLFSILSVGAYVAFLPLLGAAVIRPKFGRHVVQRTTWVSLAGAALLVSLLLFLSVGISH